MTGLSTQQRKTLRDLLAEHFPEADQLRMVCQDAGLERQKLNLSGTPQEAWHHVIGEAVRQREQGIRRLLEAALAHQPRLATHAMIQDVAPGLEVSADSGARQWHTPGTLTWLHLSDMKFGINNHYDRSPVHRTLLRNVLARLPDRGLQPDLICVTGDLVDTGNEEEFQIAETFLREANRVLALPDFSRWCIVPGNHDVTRSEINPRAKKNAPHNVTEMEELLEQSDDFQRYFTHRLIHFHAFAARLLGKERALSDAHPWRTEGFDLGGMRVAVLSLNTVWASRQEKERGKLLLGAPLVRQAQAAARELEPDLSIALTHHPLEALEAWDRASIGGSLHGPEGVQVHLRSDVGLQPFQLTGSPSADRLEVAAGIVPGNDQRPLVTLVQLCPALGEGTLHAWSYNPSNGDFWTEDRHRYREMKDGQWTFKLPSHWFPGRTQPSSSRGSSAFQPPASGVRGAHREGVTTPTGRVPPIIDHLSVEHWRLHLQGTVARNNYIELQGIRRLGGVERTPLERVYVELSMDSRDVKRGEPEENGRLGGGPMTGALEGAAELEGEVVSSIEVAGEKDEKDGTDGTDGKLESRVGLSMGSSAHSEWSGKGFSLPEALHRSARASIIGAPGSGKTTLLRYVAQIVARGLLEPDSHGQQARDLLGQPDGPLPFPILVTFSELSVFLGGEKRTRPTAADLVHFLAGHLKAHLARIELKSLQHALDADRILLLLDGLDEVPDQRLRLTIGRAINSLLRARPGLRVVITSRTLAYADAVSAALTDLDRFHLRKLTWDAVERFVRLWHGAVYQDEPQEAARRAGVVYREIRENPLVAELARTPNILTLIVVLRHFRTKLPEERAELYQQVIELFLESKDRDRGLDEAWADQSLGLSLGMKQGLLEQLAWKMHSQGAGAGRSVEIKLPICCFAKIIWDHGMAEDYPDALAQAVAFLNWLELRTGLLERDLTGDEDRVKFAHLGYQEFMTARYLLHLASMEATWEVVKERVKEPWWDDTIRMLINLQGQRSGDLLRRLSGADTAAVRGWGWRERGRGLALAMGGLSDLCRGADSSGDGKGRKRNPPEASAQQAVRAQLVVLTGRKTRIPLKDRLEALLALGEAGDPRLGMNARERWAWIEPGSFAMGDDTFEPTEEQRKQWGGDPSRVQKPAHRVRLTDGFWMGRYPVTNAEYGRFLADEGHLQRVWWSPEGWWWRNLKDSEFDLYVQTMVTHTGFKKEWANFVRFGERPGLWEDDRFNAANQPVVGVSWYEAEAYCRWLTCKLQDRGLSWLKGRFEVTLASEAQWERTARGRDGRLYAWGSRVPDETRANFGRTVGRTTPVGAYPMGSTPGSEAEAIHDLSGNVWEWCRDVWRSGLYQERAEKGETIVNPDEQPTSAEVDDQVSRQTRLRVLRGGAWHNTPENLRGSVRGRSLAGFRDSGVGFRCVLCVPPSTAP